jgi:hypothetical protein
MCLACGTDGPNAGLGQRLGAVEEFLEVREPSNPYAESLKPMFRIADNLIDSTLKSGSVPPPIAGAINDIRDRLKNSNKSDPIAMFTDALSGTLASSDGQAAMEIFKQMLGGNQMASSAFAHMSQATSLDDGLARFEQLTADPVIQENIRAAVSASAGGTGQPSTAAPIDPSDFN